MKWTYFRNLGNGGLNARDPQTPYLVLPPGWLDIDPEVKLGAWHMDIARLNIDQEPKPKVEPRVWPNVWKVYRYCY